MTGILCVSVVSKTHPWTGEPGWVVISVVAPYASTAHGGVEAKAAKLMTRGWGVWLEGHNPYGARAFIMYRKLGDKRNNAQRRTPNEI